MLLVDIADVEHRLRREQAEHAKRLLLLVLARDEACRLAFAQSRQRPADEIEGRARFRIAAARALLQRLDAPLQTVEVGEHQLGLDGLDVLDRRDPALEVNDVASGKAAHDMNDGVDFADVGQELIAQTLPARGAAHQAGDVDEGEPGRDDGG